MKPMGMGILAALIFCHFSAFAKPRWIEACEAALGLKSRANFERLNEIAELLNNQIRVNNRFTPYPVEARIESLKFLSDNPTGVIMRPALKPAQSWVTKPEMAVMVNPNMLHLDFADIKTELGKSPALLLVFDNVQTLSGGKEALLAELLEKEAQAIRERNPDMQFQLRMVPAVNFGQLEFASRDQAKMIAWIEGDLENFQAKRILLVMMENAFEHLAADPAYVRTI
jgi:hypothetical protein